MGIVRIRRAANSQPQYAPRLRLDGRLLRGSALAIMAGNQPVNLVSGAPLALGGSGLARVPLKSGVAASFRKNGWLQTEQLAAIGTRTFVEFWHGVPSGDFGNQGNGDSDPTFLTGSPTTGVAMVARIGAGRGFAEWGAIYEWGAASSNVGNQFNSAGDILTPGVLTTLVVVRRQSGMEFWRDGKLVGFAAQPPKSIAATAMLAGSFVDATYWTSASDMMLSGRIVADWSPDEVRAFCANPWQIFDGPTLTGLSKSTAIADTSLTGGARAVAAASGSLTTSIPLSGDAAVRATAAGTLSTAIPLAGTATARASSTGALSTSIPLAGAAPARADAAGALSTAITLQGDAVARVSVTGALSSAIALAGSAAVRSVVAGDLGGGPATLSGTITARASATGSLSTSITLVAAAVARAYTTGVLSSRITLSGLASMATTVSGVLTAGRAASQIDISKVSPSRIVSFDGSGSRIVVFEGSGKRTRINEMSAKVPTKVGDKWICDRDPEEESYYAADITDELADRFTSVKDGDEAIEILLHGVEQVGAHDLQVAEVNGAQRTFVVVFLVGIDADPPDDWHWLARVRCANGERFDKTTWFKRMDT